MQAILFSIVLIGCTAEGPVPESPEIMDAVWVGDPQEAAEVSDEIEFGYGSTFKLKLYPDHGSQMARFTIEGPLKWGLYKIEEDDFEWDRTSHVVLEDDTLFAFYEVSLFSFEADGTFVDQYGRRDRQLLLTVHRVFQDRDSEEKKDPEVVFRDMPMQREVDGPEYLPSTIGPSLSVQLVPPMLADTGDTGQ